MVSVSRAVVDAAVCLGADESEISMSPEKRIRIIGDHPHRGETGTVRDDLAQHFGMWQIDLDPGGTTNGCFADQANLRLLRVDEDPYS